MTDSPVPAPHRILLEWPLACVVIAALSLLLSWLALHLDPVINDSGVDTLWAARYFSAGQWRGGLALLAGDSPFYALGVAAVSALTGLPTAYGAYALNAAFHALLVLGFVGLVAVLGGGRRAQGLAALLVLLWPALNALRVDVTTDTAYWALYLWAVAWFVHYTATGERGSAVAAGLAGLACLLLGVEALVFLVVVPLWLWVRGRSGAGRSAWLGLPVVVAAAAVLVAYVAWRQVLQFGDAPVFAGPLDALVAGWEEAGRGIRFKLEALREGFLDHFSQGYDYGALTVTIVLMVAAGLVKALGTLYAALTVYSLISVKRFLESPARYWWGVFAVLATVLLLAPAVTRFAVATRDALTAALTLLALVPLGLERLWLDGPASGGLRRWYFPVVMALVLYSGVAGLDLRSTDLHLREAGLWLRANAPAGSDLLSNSRVVVYYSGLDGYGKSAYTWRQVMNRVHRDRLADYDYVALAINRTDRHREGILMRRLDRQPVKVVAGGDGDRVLIFAVND